jgi:NAD(P)H-nitrite reductase large subunit
MRHIIIGSGIAGTTAAEELRKLDATAEIVLIGEEHEVIYSRVLLPHYAKGIVPREKIFLKKETWYLDKDIEWLCGVRCEEIDTVNRHVVVSDGREIPYDKLLITVGAEIHTLPYEGENVCYFQTLGDTEHLIAKIASCSGRGIAYGGSFIACELIDLFVHRGMKTVAAFRGPWMFSRILDAESGALVTAHLKRVGVDVRPGSETIESVCATSEDIVAVGVGIAPELDWIRDAGIATNRGILANARLETNVADVYAAGDIAEFDDIVVGRRVMAGNWPSAQMQGRVAARNMAGTAEEFQNVSAYATNLAGLDIIAIGDTDRAASDSTIIVGSVDAGGVTQLFVRSGKLVGATLVGRNRDRKAVTDGIRAGLPVEDVKLQ